MNWKILKETIYYWDGSWRDIYVFDVVEEDWIKWIDYINSIYRITWYNGKTDKTETKVDFTVIKAYWAGNEAFISTANVFLDQIQINTHFFEETEFESDIDPREFNSIEDHYRLIGYLKELSQLIEKPVYVTPENAPEKKLITVDKKDVKVDTDTDPGDWPVRIKK